MTRAPLSAALLAVLAFGVGRGATADEAGFPDAWLRHEDPVLRALAAFELRRHAEDGVVTAATRLLAAERDEVVVGCVLGSLVGRARADLVTEGGSVLPGLLLRRLEHPHPVLARRAREVLTIVADRDLGTDTEAWRAWWRTSRPALDAQQAEGRAARAARPKPPAEVPGTTTAAPEPDLYDHVEGLRRDGLDLVIVLDHTGSMAPVIGAATSRAASLVARLRRLVPRFRAGLVTYDDAARVRAALTAEGDVLADAFRKVVASGGGDWEEGGDKGIALALRQASTGWARRAWRVVVLIGDAPPHTGDVPGLLRRIDAAREDVLYDHPLVVHTVATSPRGVDHFGEIAARGGGLYVTLGDVGRLEEELVALAFGTRWRDRVGPWLREIELLDLGRR